MKQNTKSGKTITIIGLILQIIPLVGVIACLIDMFEAFSAIADEGVGDPKILADEISQAIVSVAITIPFALIGIILIAIGLFHYKYRSVPLFWILLVCSILLILLFPVGTIMAIPMIIYLIVDRKSYFSDMPIVT